MTVGVLSAAVVGLELVRPVHVVDLGARAGLETGIVLSGLIGVGLLASRLNRTRRLRDLLLLAALATVALTDFAFAELPLLGIGRAAGADDYGWFGCTLVAAVAFAAVALVRDRRILGGKRRALAGAAFLYRIGSVDADAPGRAIPAGGSWPECASCWPPMRSSIWRHPRQPWAGSRRATDCGRRVRDVAGGCAQTICEDGSGNGAGSAHRGARVDCA